MKVIILLVAKVLAVIAANIAFVWAIIEFILYLAKDKVFNWWSVWVFVISIVVAIASVIIAAVWQIKLRKRISDDMKQIRTTGKKSQFQKRFEEMHKQRSNT